MDYASKTPDGSQIPGEWHRWVLYMTDNLPNSEEPRKVSPELWVLLLLLQFAVTVVAAFSSSSSSLLVVAH